MRRRTIRVDWEPRFNPRRKRWELYRFPKPIPPRDRDDKGELIAVTEADAGFIVIEIEEGSCCLQVLERLPDALEDFRSSHRWAFVTADAGQLALTAPADPAVVPVNPESQIGFVMSPPAPDANVAYYEVVEGVSAEQGGVIARIPAPAPGAMEDAALPRLPQLAGILEGAGFPEARTLWLVPYGASGKRGTPIQFDATFPDRDDCETVLVASVIGGTRTNIGAPGSADGWETDATDNVRLKPIPAMDSASFGAMNSGLFASQPMMAKYVTVAHLETTEVDLGAKLAFVLDMYGVRKRKSSTAEWPPMNACVFPMEPRDVLEHAGLPEGPAWTAALIAMDGKPVRGSYPPTVQVKFGNASPISMAYRPHVPGEQIVARYVRVKITFREPTGLFQLTIPKLVLHARVKRRTVTGSGTVNGLVDTATVSLPVHPVTGESGFQKSLVAVVTPKTAGRRVMVTATNPTANPPTITVRHELPDGAQPTTATDFFYSVTGY